MNSEGRVLTAVNHKENDRIPIMSVTTNDINCSLKADGN